LSKEKIYTISVKKASELLDLSSKSIYRKCRDGTLDAKKINTKYGKQWMMSKEDPAFKQKAQMVEEVIEAKETMSKQEIQQAVIEVLKANNQALNERLDNFEDTFIQKIENNITEQTSEQVKKAVLLLFKEQQKENKALKQEIKLIKEELEKNQEKRDMKLIKVF
jgi:cell shape-determining protein MreC